MQAKKGCPDLSAGIWVAALHYWGEAMRTNNPESATDTPWKLYVMCQRKNIAENYVSHLISLSLILIQTQTYTYPHILSSSQQKGDILKLTNLNHPQRWPKVAFLCITNGHLSTDSYFSTMMRGNKSNSNHWHFLDEGNVLCRSWGPPCPAPLSLWLRQMKYVIYSWFSIPF